MSKISTLPRLSLLAALLLVPAVGVAQEVLTVEAGSRTESFTLDELMAMPQTTVVTRNDYVDHAVTFSGPSLKSILEQFGVTRDATIKARALNDFSVDIPASDAFDYDVILALLADGKSMPVRDKGPIWVIYPMDDHPELNGLLYNSRLIWQLRTLSVQ